MLRKTIMIIMNKFFIQANRFWEETSPLDVGYSLIFNSFPSFSLLLQWGEKMPNCIIIHYHNHLVLIAGIEISDLRAPLGLSETE